MHIGFQTIFVIIIVIIICYFSLDIKNDHKSTKRVRFDPNDQIIGHTPQFENDNTNELLQQESDLNGYVTLSNYPNLLNKKIKRDKQVDPYERETHMYIYEGGRLGIYHPDVDHYHMKYKAITGDPIDSFYSSISGNSYY